MSFLSLITFDLEGTSLKVKVKVTRLLCEFGANPLSGSQDISYTNKKPQTDGAKNRTFRSSLHVVKTAKVPRLSAWLVNHLLRNLQVADIISNFNMSWSTYQSHCHRKLTSHSNSSSQNNKTSALQCLRKTLSSYKSSTFDFPAFPAFTSCVTLYLQELDLLVTEKPSVLQVMV